MEHWTACKICWENTAKDEICWPCQKELAVVFLREQTSQIHNSLSLYQLPRKDGGESIIQITVIHLYPESRWCQASALAGPAEDGFHVDPWDLSQAPSKGNYLEHAEHLTRFAMIYVALCTGNIIRDTRIGLLLINFTLILPLDTFQYNMGNPGDWKLIA